MIFFILGAKIRKYQINYKLLYDDHNLYIVWWNYLMYKIVYWGIQHGKMNLIY